MDHLEEAKVLASRTGDPNSSVGAHNVLATMYATISIAQSLADLAKLAARLEPLLVRLEEEIAKDGIHELKDHAA